MTPRARAFAGIAVVALLGLHAARRARLTSDIAHFLPADADARDAQLSRALATSDLARVMVLVVEGDAPGDVVPVARALAETLRAHPAVAWVRSGSDPSLERAVYELYFPRRHAFLSNEPERELPIRLSDDGLRAAARTLRGRLASPAGAMLARMAGDDPLLGFAATLDRLRSAQESSLTLADGQLTTADGRHAVIFLATRASAFDAPAQRPFLRDLDAAFARARGHRPLRLLSRGAHRVSVAAEAQIRGDAERITALGSLGVAALFLLVHRSPRYLVLASIPILAGTAVAAAAGLAIFGALHGLTLAFGASLIGVCFDYPVYLINHHTLRPAPEGPSATLARVWPGVALGALTTVGGLLGMALTSFPGLREIAVFSAFGVAGALAATRYIVPPLLPREPIPVAFQRRLAERATRVVAWLRASPAALALAALVTLLGALGLTRLRWDDDARALTPIPASLQREERAVAALVSRFDEGRFVVVTGRDDEEALARNDRAAAILDGLRARGALGRYRSAHAMLWSATLQRANETALRASPDLPRRLDAAFTAEGFRAGVFGGFTRAVAAPPPPPLTREVLASSPMADLLRPFRINVGARVGYLSYLGDVADPGAIAEALRAVPDARVFDQRAFLAETWGRYRARTAQVLALGLGAVLAMLLARYRDLRVTLAALAPATLAAAIALGTLGLLGIPANLMHLLGLLLVLSVGADYGIFIAEIDRHPEASRETLLSVAVAWMTAMLSFGVLAASSTPPLRAIGLTTGVGITLSWLLAPVARRVITRELR